MKKLFNFNTNIALFTLLLLVSNAIFCVTIVDGIAEHKTFTIDAAGCNLIVKDVDDDKLELGMYNFTPNWFAGVFTGLLTDKPLTLTLNMNDTDADVQKWDGLRPLYTYSSFWDYNTYIYYTKNIDGYWVSSDMFLKGDDKLFGNGKTPVQNIVPEELAEEFLSEDGKYWSAWSEIIDTKVNAGSNIFTMTQKFNFSDASIAMRIPYTYRYQEIFMSKLYNANIDGVSIYNIGKSLKKRDLYVIEIRDSNATNEELQTRPVALIYGAEDGDESDGSWVVNGAIRFLLSGDPRAKEMLKKVTFLFIPLLDPDGMAHSTYADLTYEFTNRNLTQIIDDKVIEYDPRPEVLAYMKFIIQWVSTFGRRLDLVINLHNVECNEAVNVMCPLIDVDDAENITAIKDTILSSLPGVTVSHNVWMTAFVEDRLMSWCYKQFGSIQIPFEVNSRYPDNRLSLLELDNLGESFVEGIAKYFESEAYEKAFPQIEQRKKHQEEQRKRLRDSYNPRTDGYAAEALIFSGIYDVIQFNKH